MKSYRDMRPNWIKLLAVLLLFISSCKTEPEIDGPALEQEVLHSNDLSLDRRDSLLLQEVIKDINCADSPLISKKIVLSRQFRTLDTSQILLIPFSPNGRHLSSSAYSDVKVRYILINTSYVKEFALKNGLGNAEAFRPVLTLMLLHEIGHFILNKGGAFDALNENGGSALGEQVSDSEPEYLTGNKQLELKADSLAINMIKNQLDSKKQRNCLNMAMAVQLILPGMQFQLSGIRTITNFGSTEPPMLHDPSHTHPNLELRISFMNYFLFPTTERKAMIDDYIYNRTAGAVNRQQTDPSIFQGMKKKLP